MTTDLRSAIGAAATPDADLAQAERDCLRGSALGRAADAVTPAWADTARADAGQRQGAAAARAALKLKAASWYAHAHATRIAGQARAGAVS